MLTVAAHELLELEAFTTELPRPLGELESPESLQAGLSLESSAPFQTSDEVKAAVRALLRLGGFKPSGRNKPAAEYLVRAAGEGKLSTINAAVDACNVTSLHSGLPVSVVDLDRTVGALRIAIAPEGSEYVFNASGQVIDVAGLLCLFDTDGPCANAVKDAQRTKTHPGTTRTLSVVWGTKTLPGRAAQAATWYRELLEGLGAKTTVVEPKAG